MDIALIITVLGVLVAVTNIIVGVVKNLTSNALPTNLLATIVGIVITVATGIAYFQIKTLDMYWYTVVAFVVAGFLVAYAAMFGFDKLKEAMNWKDGK